MDYSNITDLQTLKALAYDQIAAKEQAQAKLQAINNQILAVAGMDAEKVRENLPNANADPSTTTTTTDAPENGSELTGDADGDDSTTTTTTAAPSV